jgi:NAD(P)-dependent dehydrogenase (short-subunit alcohol dehydrogenase family)
MELAGTSALVTGGSSGLGAAAASMLAAAGAVVINLSRGTRAESEAAWRAGIVDCTGDVTDPVAAAGAVERAVGLQPLRSVVLCAGGGRPMQHQRRYGAVDGDLD